MTWEGTFGSGYFAPPGGSLELRGLARVVTGRLGEPPLEAATVRMEEGRVAAIGAPPP